MTLTELTTRLRRGREGWREARRARRKTRREPSPPWVAIAVLVGIILLGNLLPYLWSLWTRLSQWSPTENDWKFGVIVLLFMIWNKLNAILTSLDRTRR